MYIIHGTWIPDGEEGFVQAGAFYLWVETGARQRCKHLGGKLLHSFVQETLGLAQIDNAIVVRYFVLPVSDGQVLPSLELARYLEIELPERCEWQICPVECIKLAPTIPRTAYGTQKPNPIVRVLRELHFLVRETLPEVQLGADLLFWYQYSQFLKGILFKDHYIPALKWHQPQPESRRKKLPEAQIYTGWEYVSSQYEAGLKEYAAAMPLICAAGFAAEPAQVQLADQEALLRHFSEWLLVELLTHTAIPDLLHRQLQGSLLEACLKPGHYWLATAGAVETYQHWQTWRHKLTTERTAAAFDLGLQLEAPDDDEDLWQLHLLVIARSDPSWQLSLYDYWNTPAEARAQWQEQLGDQFERQVLLALGYAARIWPPLWQGLHTAFPTGLDLEVEDAFTFLQEAAWVLEETGCRVIVPAWWTPAGRRRAKLRLQATSRAPAGSANVAKSYFSLDALVEYRYELSVGGEAVSEAEWLQLVEAKTPLVRFRGEWLALDRAQMAQMLEFWRSHQQAQSTMSLVEWLKFTASEPELEVEPDPVLAEVLTRLQDHSRLEPIADPPGLRGQLRPYQRRGLAWLTYLEQLGLGACLADDMGLGKSLQVIARLVHEKAEHPQAGPTLLVAPTSVVGNWQREIAKFAPHLRTLVHHGPERLKDEAALRRAGAETDVVITSYTLARKDEKLLAAIQWRRLVVDEAQNLKNPKAAQTRAIQKLPARTRVALTGTPVENRLLDLWSIVHFLNPGYLGSEAQFRKRFELPIARDNNRERQVVLRRLVEPLILRRVKTDPQIIHDLPDKIEQKVFCQLTREQASLYEALTHEVERQIESAEGIARQGLILATLTRLKQLCNHPMQFLQDNSPFTPERSHKLSRFLEMAEEVISEGESLLVFTQFHELGAALERYLRQSCRYTTYYIHGGVAREKREQMIARFQDPESEPAVFILSLKAGGVGITLTRANHVFHFDRWWNPAVENQATDRAFRIGQTRNVFVHKFVAQGTLEERIDQMIEDKQQLAAAIVGNDESWLAKLDNERFKALITLGENALIE